MIEVFLHIGTEKTGSSFIQSSFAKNRRYLIDQGIWYPTAGKREKDMIEGRISPGNAYGLYRIMSSGNEMRLRSLMEGYINQARDHHCQKILLSNEQLIEVLAELDSWHSLLSCFREVGAVLTSVLLVIRNPVEHAISLYKHRAKTGKAPPLQVWLKQGYNYHNLLNSFSKVIYEFSTIISVRGYYKDGRNLLQLFYVEWLKVKIPHGEMSVETNSSLTLSELRLLSHLAQHEMEIANRYYEFMIKIPAIEKSDDFYLNQWATNQATYFLAPYQSIWKTYNNYLPKSEHLDLPQLQNTRLEYSEIYSFNQKQLYQLTEFISSEATLKTIIQRIARKLRLILGRIIIKLLGRHN